MARAVTRTATFPETMSTCKTFQLFFARARWLVSARGTAARTAVKRYKGEDPCFDSCVCAPAGGVSLAHRNRAAPDRHRLALMAQAWARQGQSRMRGTGAVPEFMPKDAPD